MKGARRGFARIHPAVSLFYFILVFFTCFLFQNPVLLCLLLLSGFAYQWASAGLRAPLRTLVLSLPLAIFLMVLTPVFNKSGATPLVYINEMPITKEALVYGCVTALVLTDTILWFSIANGVLGKDQVVYLFGKPFPTAALLIGMIFRAVTDLGREFREIRFAQRGLGLGTHRGPLRLRLQNGASQFLCLLGNALEHSVDTAMSMRCRGYGLKGSSRRRPYAFHTRDWRLLGALLVLSVALGILFSVGSFQFRILPEIESLLLGRCEIAGYLVYTVFVFLPLITLGREEWLWRSLRSRM